MGVPFKFHDFITNTTWDLARGPVAEDLEGLHEAVRQLQDGSPDAANDDVQILPTSGTIVNFKLKETAKVLIATGNALTIEGFEGVWPGRLFYLLYTGPETCTVVYNAPNAVPNFRIFTAGNSDIVIGTNEAVLLIYNSDAKYWQGFGLLDSSGTGGAGISELTGDVTAGPGTGSQVATIANNAVTTVKIANDAVTNAKLDNMSQSTIKGRAVGSGTGDPQDLTSQQATAILVPFIGDSGSGGVKGLVPAPAAGDTAADKFLSADGTWARVPASDDYVVLSDGALPTPSPVNDGFGNFIYVTYSP